VKLFVAIPAGNGSLSVETARSLLNEQGAAFVLGTELHVGLLPGCSLIPHARNQLVRDFLLSDCERMVFVDSDIGWEPGQLLALAAHPEEFVGGAYRFKKTEEAYPIEWLPQENLYVTKDGLVEVKALPTGFLSLHRSVFTKLREAHPERSYTHMGHLFHAYFHCPPGQGEDGAFCADWRALDGHIWLKPDVTLTHVGETSFVGNFDAWFRKR